MGRALRVRLRLRLRLRLGKREGAVAAAAAERSGVGGRVLGEWRVEGCWQIRAATAFAAAGFVLEFEVVVGGKGRRRGVLGGVGCGGGEEGGHCEGGG